MKNLKALHVSVLAIFAAFTSTTKSERHEYETMAKLLKAAPLNDAECVKTLRDDLFATFGETHKDAAQIRVNIVNNARRVAYGGMKDSKAVRGKGVSAMLDVVATVASIRELKKVLADAVPDGLKSEGHGGKRKGKSGKGKSGKAISVPAVATREEAFAAARKILEFTRDKFVKPSETAVTESINKTLELLAK